jgi:Ca-activated chloride channel homolog
VIYDYNKFCELAKINILKNIEQPELFFVRYPQKKDDEPEEKIPVRQPKEDFPVAVPDQEKEVPVAKEEVTARNNLPVEKQYPQEKGRMIHDTIKVTDIIRIETRRMDTVYLQKHDTIYLSQPGEDMMSMDGYATNNLVFLLDVSGSMSTGQKLPLLQKSMLLLLKVLRPEDNVSIVVYSGKARTVLTPTSAREQEKIIKVIDHLRSDGGTDGNSGIKLAYKVADGNYIRGGNNRIVLATDGEFPLSDESLALVQKFSGQDIFLTVFNFGRTTTAVENLKKLAATGKGNYEFITRENSDVKLIKEAKLKRKK